MFGFNSDKPAFFFGVWVPTNQVDCWRKNNWHQNDDTIWIPVCIWHMCHHLSSVYAHSHQTLRKNLYSILALFFDLDFSLKYLQALNFIGSFLFINHYLSMIRVVIIWPLQSSLWLVCIKADIYFYLTTNYLTKCTLANM